jgi:uncharacterized protein YbbC (DUF1343 family)
LELAVALQRLYPGKIDFDLNHRLIGNMDVIKQIKSAEDADDIQDTYREALEAFKLKRNKYLLYR